MKIKTLLLGICSFIMSASAQTIVDEVSYSNTDEVKTHHVHLELDVRFDKKVLKGFVEHQMTWVSPDANTLVLDTRDLVIDKVEAKEGEKWVPLKFQLAKRDPALGSKLTIDMPKQYTTVRVHYQSQPQASGLQWLKGEQTAGKKHPFMYSQSQAIHARSWIPVQDTPAMRVTYTARITTPKPLLAVMSADNSKNTELDGDHEFSMPQAIPPYLIAIGVGDLKYKRMSKQTAVFAEESILDAAVAEFDDTQKMIVANEELYGPYLWGQYDLLILPPAFPFGGMENPRLSFITPTVIAGDKSLVNLIAHELAHSWSGNLVTNATWRDLWLNEGFTSYVENRVMESLFGRRRAVMEQALSVADLKEELAHLPADDTRLKLPLNGRDPDEAFSGVPYVKGQLFLIYLEEKFGRERFDPFVKKYFDDHAFKSLTTEMFIEYLQEHLLKPYPNVVSMDKINEWIFEPGLPADAPNPTSDAFEKVEEEQKAWLAGKKKLKNLSAKKWSVHEWLYFINTLPRDISRDRMAMLDNAFKLTNSSNAEIAFAWFRLAIGNNYPAITKSLENHLVSIGRRKLIVPLYKQLAEHSKEKRVWALEVYKKARPGYHPLAQGTIDALFKG
ncbi:M1 family metallopeptidase [Pleionea sp. CnH1-48]|uniref:M1 family metallopeptidase n=1 Tax=Pleionea sp. CnH1-48 TaxID=2954494 RepID=UPI0020972E19|nr:M1 family metallopeptidase [Pleionea sp. CnH1-48]MCO7227182.1 M1 family metallopeptidase [Pleionea sp. CnH1-48]